MALKKLTPTQIAAVNSDRSRRGESLDAYARACGGLAWATLTKALAGKKIQEAKISKILRRLETAGAAETAVAGVAPADLAAISLENLAGEIVRRGWALELRRN